MCLALAVDAQTFEVSGKVASDNDTPVEFAEILLLQNNAVMQYHLTDVDGNFIFNLQQGEFEILIRQLGDTLHTQKITVAKNIDLGIIKVQIKPELLQEVTVIAKQKLIERKFDRMVFNVTNLASADGGDALDVLKVTPSLLVDDGGISIVGKSSVNVMVNDRPVKLSGEDLTNFLKNLRSNDIQSIEVITTPPAKYEAEGNSGLINIIMKKVAIDTWNASVSGVYMQTKYARGAFGGNFNYRKKALSFYANASYSGGKSNSDDEATTIYPVLKWENKGNAVSNSNSFSARTGVEIEVTNNFIVGTQYTGSFGNWKNINNNSANLFDLATNNNTGLIQTISNSKSKFDFHSGNLFSVIKLDTLGRKINIDFDILRYNVNDDATYKSNTLGSLYPEVPNGYESANNVVDRKITNYATQIDVEHPIGKLYLNYGFKLSFSRTDNDIHAFSLSSGTPIINPNQTNQFLYNENSQAVYISGRTQFGKWQLQLGLRGENTQFKGNSVTMDTVFKKSYFELFPTAYLSYNHNDKNVFSLEYGKRIYRPNFEHLNPFRNYASPYYYFVGNPELRPMFTDNITANYIYNEKLYISLYYTKDKDNFGGGIMLPADNGYTQYGTRLNYFDSYGTGIGISYVFNSLSWWRSNISVSAYYKHSDSKIYPLTPKTSKGYGAYFQTSNTFYLNNTKTISAGFNFSYMPPNYGSDLTYNYSRMNLDAFVRMLFLNKNLSVTLAGNNLLGGYSYNWRSERNGLQVYSKAHYNPTFFRMAVSYSFGSKKVNVQRHNVINEEEQNRI